MHKKIRQICALCCFLYLALSSALTPALPASEAPPSTQQAVLEAKFNAEKEKTELQIQGLDKRMEDKTQELDKRIGGIGFSINIFGILLTALLGGFGLIGLVSVKRRAGEEAEKAAKETADQWFKAKGEALESEIELLRVKLGEKHNEVSEQANEFSELVTKAKQCLQAQVSEPSSARNQSEPTAEALKSNEALAKEADLLRHKPEADYSFDDWNTRAFNAFRQQDLAAAVMYWASAAKIEDASKLQIAQAMLNKGFALNKLECFDEAIDAYVGVIERFGKEPEPELRELVARAMLSKGTALGLLDRFGEAIEAYVGVIERFGKEPEPELPELRELVAYAMCNKGFVLSKLNEHKNAIVAYNEVISRFGEASEPELCEIVAKVKQLKAELSSLNPATKEGE